TTAAAAATTAAAAATTAAAAATTAAAADAARKDGIICYLAGRLIVASAFSQRPRRGKRPSDDRLGMGKVQAQPTKRSRLVARLVAAANSLESDDLALAIDQVESLARHRR